MRKTIAILLFFLLLLSLAACGWRGCGEEPTVPETEETSSTAEAPAATDAETEVASYPPAPDGVTDPTAETVILPMDDFS